VTEKGIFAGSANPAGVHFKKDFKKSEIGSWFVMWQKLRCFSNGLRSRHQKEKS